MPYCESFFSCVYYVLRCTVVSVTPFRPDRPLLGRYSKGKDSLSITWRDERKTTEAGDKRRRIFWLSAFLTLARVHSIWQYSVHRLLVHWLLPTVTFGTPFC